MPTASPSDTRPRTVRPGSGRRGGLRVLGVALVIGCVPALAGCGDREWSGPPEERIDAAVASVDFSSVGGIDCDYRRPGNNISGRAATRLLGIADARNGQAVVDLLIAAGYTTNGRSDDLSDGSMTLSDSSGLVEFAVSVVAEGNRSYAFGYCTSPADGAIRLRVSG